MRIPIFLSCPTVLSERQKLAREQVLRQLRELQLEPRALGRSDYPTDFPLREVYVIAKHCSGGVILGFEQIWVKVAEWRRQTPERATKRSFAMPTPWNQLEAGILFSLKLPLLIFKEQSITGGVFDEGVTDVFVHKMPIGRPGKVQKQALQEVFLKWHAKVQAHYKRY